MACLDHTCRSCQWGWSSNTYDLCPKCGSWDVCTLPDEEDE